jgi:phenylalanyl-tRNA synthetase alpha chain
VQRTISAGDLAGDLELRDLTDPSGGPHALQLLIANAAGALSALWSCPVRLRRGNRLVTVAENYDDLGFLDGAVTRDARYTRYVDDTHMLRSHSTAMVPAALAELAAEASLGVAPRDVLLVCPGLCYRRDSIDWQHTGTPHQVDLWRISRQSLGEADLEDMIETLCGALVPGHPYRCERRVHPYTLAGRQIDVSWNGTWVEIAECGLAHPELLRRRGLGEEWSGLALGMGLDRLLMLVKAIPDIRLLRAGDPRIRQQMTTLEPYHPTSAMPAVIRDLSIAVDDGDEAEDLGDRVRETLGAQADVVEEVAIVSSTAAEDLPAAARRRLGIAAGQQNLLVRVTLRALDRTLSDAEANDVRDRLYEALHGGTAHLWATAAARPRAVRSSSGSPAGGRGGEHADARTRDGVARGAKHDDALQRGAQCRDGEQPAR